MDVDVCVCVCVCVISDSYRNLPQMLAVTETGQSAGIHIILLLVVQTTQSMLSSSLMYTLNIEQYVK